MKLETGAWIGAGITGVAGVSTLLMAHMAREHAGMIHDAAASAVMRNEADILEPVSAIFAILTFLLVSTAYYARKTDALVNNRDH